MRSRPLCAVHPAPGAHQPAHSGDRDPPAPEKVVPAFSSVEDLEPNFPSERDVPPRHIQIPEPLEIEPVPQESFAGEAEDSSIWGAAGKSSDSIEIAVATVESVETSEAEIAASPMAAQEEAAVEAVKAGGATVLFFTYLLLFRSEKELE